MSSDWSGSSPPTPEWSARYAEYLKSSTARAARTAELNKQLMKRVARGELAPVTLESQLTAFLATNATSYANELAETSMEFLTGLVEVGTSYSYELLESIVPGEVPDPDNAAPDFDPGDWSNWFRRLTDYAAAQNASVTEMLRTVMEKVASGAIAPRDMQAVSEEYHGERLPGTVAKIVTLYFDLLTRLDETHSAYGDRFLETVLDLSKAAEKSDATLDLVGPIGGTASVRFAVSNTAADSTSLRSVMTDVRRADGVGPAFEPPVTISPERFVLEPGAEEILALTVRLLADSFEPGPEYVGTLHVLSPGSTLVEVPLRIRAALPGQSEFGTQPDSP
jgi:hypothetical protein